MENQKPARSGGGTGLSVAVTRALPHFLLDVALECPAGSLTAIVGPSGSGKTTLMRIVAGLETADSGRIALDGRLWLDTRAGLCLTPQRRRLGLVFQEYPLFPHMTVRRNVTFAAENPADADGLLDLFGILHLRDRRPDAISGGERQRAAICQALARQPDVLLLDEPFSALDSETRRTLRRELRALKGRLDIPILHVTHDLDEAEYLADAVLPIVRGQRAGEWLERQVGVCNAPAAEPVRRVS